MRLVDLLFLLPTAPGVHVSRNHGFKTAGDDRLVSSRNSLVRLTAEHGYYPNMVGVSHAPPGTEDDMMDVGLRSLRSRLPSTWSLSVMPNAAFLRIGSRDAGEIDAMISLHAPNGEAVFLLVEIKVGQLRSAEAERIASRLKNFRKKAGQAQALLPGSVVPVVFARYLTRPNQERLTELGVGYVDATGNMQVRSDDPPLFLADRGADHDPWRGRGRPTLGLEGEPAAKVVRTLADIRGPWKIRDLVDTAGASTGAVYRVLDYLDQEGLLDRHSNRGPIEVPDWKKLLRHWSRNYQFLHTNRITPWIAPRGLDHLLERMRDTEGVDYALTGSIGASVWEQYAPAKSVMVYTHDPQLAAKYWGLRPTDTRPNVLVAQPAYAVILDRRRTALGGLEVAAPSQVAVDLMTGPGRAPAEAEELLDWMGRNEPTWRREQSEPI